MSSEAPSSNSTIYSYEFFHVIQHADGMITRLLDTPSTPAAPDPSSPSPVLSKDIPLNQSNNTSIRIFLPRQALNNSSTLPLLVYFHGGAFIMYSAFSSLLHQFCVNIALHLNVLVVSLEYRLAPEHRLPAAYDDAMEALYWIKSQQADDWLKKYADLSNCFLMGSSAGGNMVYHVGLRTASLECRDLDPLRIKGLILHQPFFGATQRSESELRFEHDRILPLRVCDMAWQCSLPLGVDRDHEYCHPTIKDHGKDLENIKRLGWRVLVTGCDGDPLIDRQKEVAKLMEDKGMKVMTKFIEGKFHGYEFIDPSKFEELHVVLKDFMLSTVP